MSQCLTPKETQLVIKIYGKRFEVFFSKHEPKFLARTKLLCLPIKISAYVANEIL